MKFFFTESVMNRDAIFEIIILLGRPAAGKSEILEFLYQVDDQTRINAYHLGKLDVIDDFPMLWAWFEEDQILSEKFRKPRLHSDENEYFKYPYLWNLLIERINLEYNKRTRDDDLYHQHRTTLVEFSRGSEHGGYQQAFEHLSDQILSRAVIFYVQVSYAESLRKNRKRFNPERPDSILEHAVDERKLETLYRDDDFQDLRSQSESTEFLTIRNQEVPYVVFENEDDITTVGGAALGSRLEHAFNQLWSIKRRVRQSKD
jgi:hypothetical protein